VRLAVKTVAALSLLAVVMLWFGGLDTAPAGAAAYGRLAALLCIDLLLQTLLMARIPWVEREYGQDTLTRWHRWTGVASFLLLLAHVFLALGGDPLVRLWDLLSAYQSMVLAVIALAALVLRVASSARLVRRRMRYESWHLLHLYAYLWAWIGVPVCARCGTGCWSTGSPRRRPVWSRSTCVASPRCGRAPGC
jgi:predicted ferric reductase